MKKIALAIVSFITVCIGIGIVRVIKDIEEV